MKTITGAKLWHRTFHHSIDGEAYAEAIRSQKMRPSRLRAHWRRQANAFELLKAGWDKQPLNPTGTMDEK